MRLAETRSPKASRQSLPRWLDPKLILGLLLVLGSMVGGAKVVAAADDTVEVWAVSTDLPAQATLTRQDLVPKRIRFADADEAQRYVAASSPVPEGARLSRAIGAGELLPKAAVTTRRDDGLVDLPIPIDPANAPSDLRAHDLVDLYVVPGDDTSTAPAARKLRDVTVTSVGAESGLGSTGQSRITVRVAVDPARIADVTAAVTRGTPVLIRHPG